MTKVSLQCRECKNEYDSTFKYICDECFGPLDVKYDFPSITKNTFVNREHTYWRYYEMLPIQDKSNIVSLDAGMTPLIHAKRLGEKLGLNKLYIKNDSVNPTFSFKDRPAGIAVSKAKEFGLSAVGCASTGNLASATAAHAAKGGFPCYVFAPSDIEHAKIAQALAYGANFIAVDGTYDDANRIAAQIGDSKGIALVNNVSRMHMIAAQPHGCAPIVDAFKRKYTDIIPVEQPDTIAKSLAIGDPGDGRYVLKRLQQYNGWAEESTDKEILDAILLLARTEGIFTEPAGGVSVAVLKKMIEQGKIDKNDTTICYVTGNGLKTTEVLMEVLPKPQVMQADVAKISAMVK